MGLGSTVTLVTRPCVPCHECCRSAEGQGLPSGQLLAVTGLHNWGPAGTSASAGRPGRRCRVCWGGLPDQIQDPCSQHSELRGPAPAAVCALLGRTGSHPPWTGVSLQDCWSQPKCPPGTVGPDPLCRGTCWDGSVGEVGPQGTSRVWSASKSDGKRENWLLQTPG